MVEAVRLSGILVKLNDILVQYAQVILIGEHSATDSKKERDDYLMELEARQTIRREPGGYSVGGGSKDLHGVMVDQ